MHLPSEIVGAWLATGLTLVMFSFLYKDNPLFRFGEHLYVGLSVGYGLCYSIVSVIWPMLLEPLYRVVTASFGKQWDKPFESGENWWLVVPFFFSILILTRFSSRISWPSRWTFAFIMGTYSGLSIPLVVSADLLKQLVPTIQPLYQPGATTFITVVDTASIILILIGVISVLIYFFFSTEHKGIVQTVSKVGIFYMMISFGAAFGYTVMARETLAIGRFQHLIDWGKANYYYASLILLAVIAALVALIEIMAYRGRRNKVTSEPPPQS